MKRLRAVNQLPLTFRQMSLQEVGLQLQHLCPQAVMLQPALPPTRTHFHRSWGQEKHPEPRVSTEPGAAANPWSDGSHRFLQGEGNNLGKQLITPVWLSLRGSQSSPRDGTSSSEGLEGAPNPAPYGPMAKEQEHIR